MNRASRRILSFVALALTLFLVQAGAFVHGYSHLRSGPDPVGAGTPPAGQVCTECLSFSPLLAAAGAPDTVVVFHPRCAEESPRLEASPLVERSPTYAFRSRAPPRLV